MNANIKWFLIVVAIGVTASLLIEVFIHNAQVTASQIGLKG